MVSNLNTGIINLNSTLSTNINNINNRINSVDTKIDDGLSFTNNRCNVQDSAIDNLNKTVGTLQTDSGNFYSAFNSLKSVIYITKLYQKINYDNSVKSFTFTKDLNGYYPISYNLYYGYSLQIKVGVESFDRGNNTCTISGFYTGNGSTGETILTCIIVWVKLENAISI